MHRRLLLLLVVLASIASLSPRATPQAPRTIQWRHDYAAARKEAQEKNLPIFLDFYTTWCGPCKRLEQETFPDPAVAELLSEKFICLKVDGDRQKELVDA